MYKPEQHYKGIRKDGAIVRLMEGKSNPDYPFYVTINNVICYYVDRFADAYKLYNAAFRV